MELTTTFSAMPNVTSLGDLSEAWHWSHAPGLDMCAALSADGKHAFQTNTRGSFDEDLAVALMSFARTHGADLIAAPERPLTVVEGFSHPGYAFDAVAAVGPAVHSYHPDDAEVHQATWAVLPAFRCEFTGDEDVAEADYRFAQAQGVPFYNWRREPRPFLKMRFRGNDGILPDERDFFRPKLLGSWITRNEGNTDLFVEFENYRREIYTVTWTDTWTLTVPGAEPRSTTLEDLLDVVKSALYGPNIAAGTSEFPAR